MPAPKPTATAPSTPAAPPPSVLPAGPPAATAKAPVQPKVAGRPTVDEVDVVTGGLLFRNKGPVLSIETSGPRRIIVGHEAIYKFVLKNGGDSAANDVVVLIRVPDSADVIDTSATRGVARASTSGGQTVRWQVDEMQVNARDELTLKVIPRSSRALDMEVEWASAPARSQLAVEVQEAKLELQLTGPKEVDFGDKVIYELTFSNPGTAPADNVLVKLLPIDPADAADTHEIGTIAAGAKKVVEIELVARQAGTLNIRAEATADGGLHSEVRHDVIVRRADLRLAVDGPKFRFAGTSASYSIVVGNPGNAAAKNVQLGVMLPSKARFVACSDGGHKEDETNNVRWTIASLAPGEEKTLTIECELEASGANRISAAVVADGNLRDTSFVTTEVEAVADLDLEVRDPKGPVPVGQEVTYEVIIRNRGTKNAENVNVVAYFSDGIEPIVVRGRRHEIHPGRATMEPIASLAAGQEIVLKVVAKASEPGNHVFRTEVHCDTLETTLAQQETTRFYGDQPARSDSRQPTPAGEPRDPFSSRTAPAGEDEGTATNSGWTSKEPKALEPTPASEQERP
jgi:uncharacterized repeat protein (TIGR01451 family)